MSPVAMPMPNRTAAPLPRLIGLFQVLTRASWLHRLASMARAVAGAVVGDDYLALEAVELDLPDAIDHLADRLLLVVDGDDDGQLHARTT
jgi:hypothetical protein